MRLPCYRIEENEFLSLQSFSHIGNSSVKKWYASLKRITMVKEKQVAKLISEETTLNPKEDEMALAQLEKVLINQLLSGNSVQLGDWGSFNPSPATVLHTTRAMR